MHENAQNPNTPAIGRIVHAVITDKRGNQVTRPAIIVRTWPDQDGGTASYVNAQVFCDSDGATNYNDGLPNVVWKTSLTFDPTGKLPTSWHWPARPQESAPSPKA